MQQAAVRDPLIGATIGNYEVKSKLGEGGMGAVYLAEHPLIGKKVALKVLHPEFTSNDEIATRFFHEAKAVNDIQHPNIVDILDYGVIPNADQRTVYFIMEFLDGQPLTQLIRDVAPLPPERALSIALQIADALAASHRHEIVHRDLKPDNVMLVQRGRQHDFVKVLDFGIAKLTGDGPASRRTRTGVVLGTPAYMSPEQCEGRGSVDHRADIYALGILLYEMLTGQVPFHGDGFGAVLIQHLTRPPTRLSQIAPLIPPHVEAVVLKALEKEPDARYPNMTEFMHALADPVGYVESRGGLAGFLSANLGAPLSGIHPAMPSGMHSGIMPSGMHSGIMPSQMPSGIMPGRMQSTVTPFGHLTPAPGTLYPDAQPDSEPSSARRLGIIVAAAAGVIAIAAGSFIALSGSPKQIAGDELAAPPSTAQPSGTSDVPSTPVAVEDDDSADDSQARNNGQAGDQAIARITVQVTTDPEGAEVYLDDDDEPRGVTPLDFELDRGSAPMTLTVKLDRFRSETRSFTPDKNLDFELKLSLDKPDTRGKTTVRTDKKSDKKTDKKTDKKDKNNIDKDVGLLAPDWD